MPRGNKSPDVYPEISDWYIDEPTQFAKHVIEYEKVTLHVLELYNVVSLEHANVGAWAFIE